MTLVKPFMLFVILNIAIKIKWFEVNLSFVRSSESNWLDIQTQYTILYVYKVELIINYFNIKQSVERSLCSSRDLLLWFHFDFNARMILTVSSIDPMSVRTISAKIWSPVPNVVPDLIKNSCSGFKNGFYIKEYQLLLGFF